MDDDKIQVRKENIMFEKGLYKHEEGFTVLVTEDDKIMLSPDHPLSMRLSELFNTEKWTKME